MKRKPRHQKLPCTKTNPDPEPEESTPTPEPEEEEPKKRNLRKANLEKLLALTQRS